MGLLNGSKKEIIAIEKMRPVKKSKNAHLQSVYSRLSTGRGRFEQVVMDTLSSTMGMSSLDLMLEHGKKMLQESSDKLSTSTTNILDIVKETADIGSEASAQHEEMTSALEEAVHESDSVMNTLEESSEELEVILSQSKETITNSREMQNDMSDLSEIIGHMNEVIGSITAISAQTNLLALNASIEAARAGEAGKGFAVVAEQIRQLADETKTLTDSMGSFVANIKTASEKSVESVDNTVDSLEKMSEGIQSIWEHNTENKQSVGKITGYMKTFSDLSEEICQSFAVVEERLNTVATECEIIHAQSEELEGVNQSITSMMAPVKNIEESLDATTKQMGDMSQDPFYMLDNSAFVACVKNAVTAHESWLHKLEDMVETGEITPLQTDPTKCGFGHFYYSVNPKNAQIVPIWEGLEDKHRRFHGYAVEIIEQLGKGADVQGTLEEATKLAGELQNDFEQIIEITEDLEKKQIRVLEG